MFLRLPSTAQREADRAAREVLRHGLRRWLLMLAVLSANDAFELFATPGLLERPAYRYAGDLAPQWFWAGVCFAACLLALISLTAGAWMQPVIRSTMARLSKVAYALFCAIITLSFLAVALDGGDVNTMAMSKWLLPTVVSISHLHLSGLRGNP